jgi:hypothetical protein
VTDAPDTEPLPPAVAGERCAVAAHRRGDALAATAPPALRWLLIEYPGAWKPAAFETTPTLLAVAARANAAGVRAGLIRRPGRQVTGSERSWAFVDARPGHEGAWWGRYTDEVELLEVPLRPGAGTPSADPIYLVCTHGRHDACCAIWGRPAAAALAVERPDATWECSHVGGDRFAANLVALPHGLYYGRAAPEVAMKIVEAYETGQVVAELLRGRSALPAVVQAAEHYARQALGEQAIDAFTAVDVAPAGARTWRVRLERHGVPVTVTVRATTAPPALLTCGARRAERARIFELVSVS